MISIGLTHEAGLNGIGGLLSEEIKAPPIAPKGCRQDL